MLVRVLRTALEKAGVREFFTPPGLLAEKAGVIGNLQSLATPQRAFDIEAVIANATAIRDALAPFDSSIPQPTTWQEDPRKEQCGGLAHPAYANLRDAQGL